MTGGCGWRGLTSGSRVLRLEVAEDGRCAALSHTLFLTEVPFTEFYRQAFPFHLDDWTTIRYFYVR